MIKCVICDSNDWENVDKYRDTPKDMEMCKKCGFVTYPKKVKEESKLRDFYKSDYRAAPNVGNITTGQTKLYYHDAFLKDLFTEWKKEGKNPVVFEQGGAMGMFLDWMRGVFPKGEFYGSELTETFVRVAKHKFNIDLTDDFDPSRKYDFLSSYKVAEHVPHIDVKLREMVECLKEDGRFYISVPTWFGELKNFGTGGFGLSYYFHTNHINVWSRRHFESILNKVGLEVLKFNDSIYDETYLCKRNDKLMKKAPDFDGPEWTLKKLESIKKCSDHFEAKNFVKAIEEYPRFPYGWVGAYETKRNEWHKEGWDVIKKQLIDKCLGSCPNSPDALCFAGDLHMRYSKWDEAVKLFEQALDLRPENTISWQNIAQCFRQKALLVENVEDKHELLCQAIQVTNHIQNISLSHQADCFNWSFQDMAQIPLDFKRGEKNGTT
jgi:SAM-dependent methyltransferase